MILLASKDEGYFGYIWLVHEYDQILHGMIIIVHLVISELKYLIFITNEVWQ